MPNHKKEETNELLECHSYRQGEQTLAVVADAGADVISSICRKPDMTTVTDQTWLRFPGENMFTFKMNFTHLGDWFFAIHQDGQTVRFLKVTVYP